MNISNETSNKIKQLLNTADSNELKEKMGKIDPDMLMGLFKQINPSEADIKKAEEKIKSMSKDELLGEIMKKLKGWLVMENNPMDLLNKLIADPDAIKNIKDMLGGTSSNEQSEKKDNNTNLNGLPESMPFIYEFLNNQQNSEMFKKINKAYSGYSNNMTPGLKLLDALKPFLSTRRTENLEKIRKAVKISNAFSELKK